MSTVTAFATEALAGEKHALNTCGLAGKTKVDVPAIPPNFPAVLDSGMAWTGSSFPHESNYVLSMSDEEVAEVDAAIKHFNSLDMDGDLVNSSTFPLPTMGPKLEALSRDLYFGKGFGLVRGLKPSAYSVGDLTVAYLGIQSYVADQRGSQDKRGNMLVHIVADNSTKLSAEHHRHSTRAIVGGPSTCGWARSMSTVTALTLYQTFHNEEAGDVVCWLTRSTAAAGGKCIIASAHTVYNVLASSRPDLIRTLARSDWPFAFPRFQCRPVLFHKDGRLIMNFGRAPLLGNEAHPRPRHLPSLNDSQIEALDAIEDIARATEMEIQTQAGDMHFINNLAILHRRDSFVNGETSTDKRHLVRMRLRSTEHGWGIPDELAVEWASAFDEEVPKAWHIDPMPAIYFPLRRQPN